MQLSYFFQPLNKKIAATLTGAAVIGAIPSLVNYQTAISHPEEPTMDLSLLVKLSVLHFVGGALLGYLYVHLRHYGFSCSADEATVNTDIEMGLLQTTVPDQAATRASNDEETTTAPNEEETAVEQSPSSPRPK